MAAGHTGQLSPRSRARVGGSGASLKHRAPLGALEAKAVHLDSGAWNWERSLSSPEQWNRQDMCMGEIWGETEFKDQAHVVVGLALLKPAGQTCRLGPPET